MQHIILVTGMSGAGKSVSLKILEDIGFEAIDNIPLSILPLLVPENRKDAPDIAIGIDVRNREFSTDFLIQQLQLLRKRTDVQVSMLFLDCDDDILQQRFTETRRKHPISSDRLLTDSIRHEREIITPLKDRADLVCDSSKLAIHELKQLIRGHFEAVSSSRLSVIIQSFSFRKGLPREADLVFDVRFLHNPYYEPDLRDQNGLDEPIENYIKADNIFENFFKKLTDLIDSLLPKYEEEGKSYLTIAIGCTGGKHRSVFIANSLYKHLSSLPYEIECKHRDLT